MSHQIESVLKYLESSPLVKTALLSVLLYILLQVLRKVFVFNVTKKDSPREQKVFIVKKASQYTNYIFVTLLFTLWFAQLQVVFVSLIAVAAAMVLAFKELIMCVIGGVYLRSLNLFKEGHRIEVKDVRGFVIERNLLSTKILEIVPENNSQQTTGDVIGIPNSLFLTNAVKNESYFKGYSIKSFQYKFKCIEDIDKIEELLLQKSLEITKDYIENAKQSIASFCEREGIVIPSVNSRTKVVLDGEDKVVVLVKMAVKNDQIADTEQTLSRLVLKWKKENAKSSASEQSESC